MLPFFNTRTMSSDAAVSGGVLLRSPSSPWIRFTWQSSGVPDSVKTDSSDVVRPATKEEVQKVSEVILNSLSLDSAWNGSFVKVEQYLKDAVVRLFSKDEPLCVVVPKGNRLIAASLLDPDPEASSHLLSGPAVLPEYRNATASLLPCYVARSRACHDQWNHACQYHGCPPCLHEIRWRW